VRRIPANTGRFGRCTHIHSPYDFDPVLEVSIVKLSTSTQELLAQLQTVSRVASTRSAVQALSGVQISTRGEGEGDGVELRATDMEVGLRVPLDARVERPGTVVLPARLLLDVVRTLPAGDVTLELRPTEQDVEVVGALSHPYPAHRGLPTAARAGRRPGRLDAGPGVRRDDQPRVALGVA
jgi:hypothetical protein